MRLSAARSVNVPMRNVLDLRCVYVCLQFPSTRRSTTVCTPHHPRVLQLRVHKIYWPHLVRGGSG